MTTACHSYAIIMIPNNLNQYLIQIDDYLQMCKYALMEHVYEIVRQVEKSLFYYTKGVYERSIFLIFFPENQYIGLNIPISVNDFSQGC